ncbi:MAG: hypothetical protein WAK75_04205 [Methanoregula sp.]|uniref:hypothetical protein n=1 Tax=Methanoregula sp. TaxID=2052170 RepID=UPI003BAFDAE3
MTVPPGSQSAEPIKKQDNLHHLVVIALVGVLLLIVFLIIFGETGFSGQGNSNAGSAPEVFPAGSAYAGIPAPAEMPVAEITTKMVTCQITGLLSITGTVKSNVNHVLYVEITGTGYDNYGDELSTGDDTVTINPQGTSSYSIHIIDGCQLGETGTYDVRIANINWRHTS